MRLNFNVLWVDDQPDRVSSQITAITKRMQEEGFNFVPKLCQSIDRVKETIAEDVFTDEVDLILVDWDLGNGIMGQDAIAEIRSTVQYKDVVFYSAQTAPDALRQAAYEKGVEGIYCASREQLVDEVLGVFDSLIKKVLDLDHARGIVMGATSDIDHMVNECLLVIHEKMNQAGKDKMLKDGLDYIQKRIAENSETARKLEEATTLSKFFEAHMIFTASDRLRLLSGALKDTAFSAHKDYRQHVVSYQQKVVPGRNILCHQVLVPEGKPTAVTDNQGKTMSLDETRELRKLILELRLEFKCLLSALQGADGAAAGNAAPASAAE